MDEFELIRRYFVREDTVRGVIAGIGDDGAVLQPEPGHDLIVVIDTLVAGVHFPNDIDASDLGYRAVAVNLSDVAAMGGRPRWMTLALTLPDVDEQWLAGFAEGLHDAARTHDVALVGGDTTRGDQLVVSLQLTGEIATGQAVLRSGAKVGDTIYVTGTVGDAAAGLELLRSGRPDEFLSARFLRPTARVAYGQSLSGVASAAIDVSDGLFGDLQKLLTASGVGGELDLEALPISQALQTAFDAAAQRKFALSGGDDYELCFTASVDPGQSHDTQVTAIGRVTDGDKLVCMGENGVVDFQDSGYRHFQ